MRAPRRAARVIEIAPTRVTRMDRASRLGERVLAGPYLTRHFRMAIEGPIPRRGDQFATNCLEALLRGCPGNPGGCFRLHGRDLRWRDVLLH